MINTKNVRVFPEKFPFAELDNVENIIDPVGSGDALLAYSSLALFKTKSLVMASIIGSIAAACECEKDGNIPVKIEEIINKIDFLENEVNYL